MFGAGFNMGDLTNKYGLGGNSQQGGGNAQPA